MQVDTFFFIDIYSVKGNEISSYSFGPYASIEHASVILSDHLDILLLQHPLEGPGLNASINEYHVGPNGTWIFLQTHIVEEIG
jgi:hypothetical protein